MPGRRTIAGALAAGALAVAAAGTSAGTAEAATACWHSGTHWYCNNVSGAPVYKPTIMFYTTVSSKDIVGHMYSNPSWFVCRDDTGPYVGGPHPHRWVWTKADNGAWGYMKDTAISSETNTLPVC